MNFFDQIFLELLLDFDCLLYSGLIDKYFFIDVQISQIILFAYQYSRRLDNKLSNDCSVCALLLWRHLLQRRSATLSQVIAAAVKSCYITFILIKQSYCLNMLLSAILNNVDITFILFNQDWKYWNEKIFLSKNWNNFYVSE